MRILVKYPTKGRGLKAVQTIKGYYDNAKDNSNITYLVSVDIDDVTMKKAKEMLPFATVIEDRSTSKIHACNRDIDKIAEPWDILVLASDDMICEKEGWDNYLRTAMDSCFPDTDGVLWFNDGFVGNKLNTMSILGKKYYERFNYIYHPSYKSLFSDNEFMEVADKLKKQRYFEMVLFRHQHPANTNEAANDATYRFNDKYYVEDKTNYFKRKISGFK